MKLYSWNVNGIRAVHKKGALQDFLAKHDPDVLCLQEVKSNQDQFEGDLDGYEQYWHDGERKGYSGTAIFTKVSPLSVMCGFSDAVLKQFDFTDDYGDTSKEGRVMTVEFEDYYVTTVYTPNSKGDLTRLPMRDKVWDPAYKMHLEELAQKKPVLACGDLNVAHSEMDLARPKENVGKHGFTDEERRGFDALLAAGFSDTFRALYPTKTEVYSWWTHWGQSRTRNVGWRIDYWLASTPLLEKISDAEVHMDAMGSDHCPVSITLGRKF